MILIGIILAVNQAFAQEAKTYTGPIIDMHLHAFTPENFWEPFPNPATGEMSVKNATEHYRQCIALLRKHKIVLAVLDGESPADIAPWEQMLGEDGLIRGIRKEDLGLEHFKKWVSEEEIELFGEIGATYNGYSPSDSVLLPYYEICEQFDIPVGIHTGGSFPGITLQNKKFRLRLGDPFLVEDILVEYPALRVYLMHAGGHFYERTAMLMVQYPNLYVDIAVLNWVPDANYFLSPFLRLAKDYEVLDRVMFGSDQMIWPEAIEMAIENVQALDFLTLEEKKGIFYDNAARFLDLSEEEIARHHGQSNQGLSENGSYCHSRMVTRQIDTGMTCTVGFSVRPYLI